MARYRRRIRIGLGIRVGPFAWLGISIPVGGRRRKQYKPGVHPMLQPNVRLMVREIQRRRGERVG